MYMTFILNIQQYFLRLFIFLFTYNAYSWLTEYLFNGRRRQIYFTISHIFSEQIETF